jgi:hypothetical protein
VIEPFRSSDEIYEISAQKRGFYPVFFTGTFLHIVAVEYRPLILRSLQFVIPIFMERPNLVDQRMRHALSAFIVNQSASAAHLFLIYISKFSELTDPYPIIDLFLSYARAFTDARGGAPYIQSLYHLVATVPT